MQREVEKAAREKERRELEEKRRALEEKRKRVSKKKKSGISGFFSLNDSHPMFCLFCFKPILKTNVDMLFFFLPAGGAAEVSCRESSQREGSCTESC